MNVSNILICILCLLSTGSVAAQTPLPQDMVASFRPSRTFAEKLWLPVATDTQSIKGHVRYENDQVSGKIFIDWLYSDSGASQMSTTQALHTSFQPTAVARAAGETNMLYVVGWSPRTSRVIVESWTFSQYALGSVLHEGGVGPVSTFALPSVSRVVEWISPRNTMAPIWDAAFLPSSQELFLLESGTPTRLQMLNLSTQTLGAPYDASLAGFENLQDHRTISIGEVAAGGFVIFSEDRSPWQTAGFGTSPEYFFLEDINLDGAVEYVGFLHPDQFWVRHPTPWIMDYTYP